MYDELSDTLSSYELENTVSKVVYFLQETLDNAYMHGYGQVCANDSISSLDGGTPCALLIKRVTCDNTLDLKEYSAQYTQHTPYINISLFKEKQEYIEIYVADVGAGLRHSFLEDPDGIEAGITDENILDNILTNGERSHKIMARASSTHYGGLYDITALFQEDGDKLGFKCDSRWFFDKKSQRINDEIVQNQYQGLSHGFAIVGTISWKKRHTEEYPLIEQLLETVTQHKDDLYLNKNTWMKIGYQNNIWIRDDRFPGNEGLETGNGEQHPERKNKICVFFLQKIWRKRKS